MVTLTIIFWIIIYEHDVYKFTSTDEIFIFLDFMYFFIRFIIVISFNKFT